MKLKVKIPVWGIKPGSEEMPSKDFYLTADGLMVRSFSETEARSFIEGMRSFNHEIRAYPELAGDMEIEVDLELTEENRSTLVDMLIDDILSALNMKYAQMKE